MEANEACVHHWIVESPNGEKSKGTCKKCGSVDAFYNTLPYQRGDGSMWKNKKGRQELEGRLASEVGAK